MHNQWFLFIFAKDSLRPAYPRILIASRWPEGLKTSLVMKYSMVRGSKDKSRDRKSSVTNRDNPCEEYITVMNPDNPCEEYITVANRDIAPPDSSPPHYAETLPLDSIPLAYTQKNTII